jgi:hypothetical protein
MLGREELLVAFVKRQVTQREKPGIEGQKYL